MPLPVPPRIARCWLHLRASIGPAALVALWVAAAGAAPVWAGDPPHPAPSAWNALLAVDKLPRWEVVEQYDFRRHGHVDLKEGRLVLGAGAPGTGVRWTGPFPHTDYEVTLEGMRVAGDDFFCGMTFPVAADAVTLIVGGWGGTVVGLSSIDGEPAVENETCRPSEFVTGRWYRLRVRVTRPRIEVWLDQEKIIDFTTENHQLSIVWEVEPCRPFGIATWRTTGALRDIRVRSFSAALRTGATQENTAAATPPAPAGGAID